MFFCLNFLKPVHVNSVLKCKFDLIMVTRKGVTFVIESLFWHSFQLLLRPSTTFHKRCPTVFCYVWNIRHGKEIGFDRSPTIIKRTLSLLDDFSLKIILSISNKSDVTFLWSFLKMDIFSKFSLQNIMRLFYVLWLRCVYHVLIVNQT